MNIEYLNISRRVGLLDLFKEKGFGIGVEIGTDRGGYAQNIMDRIPFVELYTLDPYIPYNEGDEVKDAEKMKEIEADARNTLSKYPNCAILKTTSMEAVKLFEDNSLDFVFIDGSHHYIDVYNDIFYWAEKIKSGGIIAGHDYKEDDYKGYGVIQAVNEYCKDNNIETLYILKKGGFVPCWMFYKV